MKKKILIGLVISTVFLLYGIHWAFFCMGRLPKGEFISQLTSPNGAYTVKAYRANGGATTSYAVRGELNYNNKKKKPRNIYWNYREDKATIEWVDNNTVIINGHKLVMPKERFDFRKHN